MIRRPRRIHTVLSRSPKSSPSPAFPLTRLRSASAVDSPRVRASEIAVAARGCRCRLQQNLRGVAGAASAGETLRASVARSAKSESGRAPPSEPDHTDAPCRSTAGRHLSSRTRARNIGRFCISATESPCGGLFFPSAVAPWRVREKE